MLSVQRSVGSDSSQLPEYRKPPVIETALGVEFLPVAGFGASHYHRFAKAVENDYPTADIQESLIASIVERFGQEAFQPPSVPAEILDSSAMRWWYESKSKEWLIQLQRDRFVVNWRRIGESQTYPRYPAARRMFADAWERFLAFLHDQQLPAPVVTQCQVDYVNHIDKGQGWTTLDEMAQVFPVISERVHGAFLPTPEVILVNLRFVIPPEKGRLHATIQPALRARDHTEILMLQLVARGRPIGQSMEAIISVHDLGHEWIVRGFTELTTERMHKLWEREK